MHELSDRRGVGTRAIAWCVTSVLLALATYLMVINMSDSSRDNSPGRGAIYVECPEFMTRSHEEGALLLEDDQVVIMLRRVPEANFHRMVSKMEDDFQRLRDAGNQVFQSPRDYVGRTIQGRKFVRVDLESGKPRQIQYFLAHGELCFVVEMIAKERPFDEDKYQAILHTVSVRGDG